jgi:hypothetical protein
MKIKRILKYAAPVLALSALSGCQTLGFLLLMLPGDKGETSAIIYPSGTHPKEVDREIPKPMPGMGLVRLPYPHDSGPSKILAALSLSKLKPSTEHCITILEWGSCYNGRFDLALNDRNNFKLRNHFITDDEGKINGNLEFISDQMPPNLSSAVVLQEGSCSAAQSEVIACGQLVYRGVSKGIRPSLRT